ncbi:Gar1/Naf1 RNA binding region-domain-containing protein [Cladochytrium replicatum]|nr:Gar1/Naf1 RNA binding region-domain-containing protein [Cladochytrium replicatum]
MELPLYNDPPEEVDAPYMGHNLFQNEVPKQTIADAKDIAEDEPIMSTRIADYALEMDVEKDLNQTTGEFAVDQAMVENQVTRDGGFLLTEEARQMFYESREGATEQIEASSSESDFDMGVDDDESSESSEEEEAAGKNRTSRFRDDDDMDDDDDDGGAGGMLRTKNEAMHLPPIEPIDVEIPSHLPLQPVGAIYSVVQDMVIVQSPKALVPATQVLDSDSILLFEDRTVLGKVFDTFGPVSRPLYAVRFNTPDEIDRVQCAIERPVFFIPDFAHFVFTQLLSMQKGTDASNLYDEEPEDHAEFSDDEKEAEFNRQKKRLQKTREPGQKRHREGDTDEMAQQGVEDGEMEEGEFNPNQHGPSNRGGRGANRGSGHNPRGKWQRGSHGGRGGQRPEHGQRDQSAQQSGGSSGPHVHSERKWGRDGGEGRGRGRSRGRGGFQNYGGGQGQAGHAGYPHPSVHQHQQPIPSNGMFGSPMGIPNFAQNPGFMFGNHVGMPQGAMMPNMPFQLGAGTHQQQLANQQTFQALFTNMLQQHMTAAMMGGGAFPGQQQGVIGGLPAVRIAGTNVFVNPPSGAPPRGPTDGSEPPQS